MSEEVKTESNEVVANPEQQLAETTESVENKLMTMQELVDLVLKSDDTTLSDNVRKFKLMMVKRSMNDVMTMMEARALVQDTLVQKIREDITIYPINALLDFMTQIDKIMDRNLALMESILPKTESMADFLLSMTKTETKVDMVDLNGRSPTSMERINQIVESVLVQLNVIGK